MNRKKIVKNIIKKKNIVIGYNGLIGGKIYKKGMLGINSKNIFSIKNGAFNTVYVAAPSGLKYLSNKDPKLDNKNTKIIIKILKSISCKKIYFFSTSSVFDSTQKLKQNELCEPFFTKKNNYGKNRYKIEQFIQKRFKNFQIIRLPGLLSLDLKKGFFFDLLNFNSLEYHHKKTNMQWYFIDNILRDLKNKCTNKPIVNFVSEPITLFEITKYLKHPIKNFSKDKKRIQKNNIVTIHAKKKYFFSRNYILKKMADIYKKKSNF